MRPTTRLSDTTSRRSIRTRSLSTVSWLAGRHCSTGTFRSRSFRRLSGTSIEDFVVNRHSGYCEHFATSMVLLLRAQGVRARLVSGFVATEWNKASGYLIVRAKDAHTWVEVLDGSTWVRYDPTPSSFQQVSLIMNILDNVRMAWYRNVVTYDLARQVQTANSLCLLYTSDAADDLLCVDLGGRRIIKNK